MSAEFKHFKPIEGPRTSFILPPLKDWQDPEKYALIVARCHKDLTGQDVDAEVNAEGTEVTVTPCR